VDGKIALPQQPGLGVKVDMEQVERANALYSRMGLGARDDAAAMQFLVAGWRFQAKRPCLAR
jgi:glucarate dehydratase